MRASKKIAANLNYSSTEPFMNKNGEFICNTSIHYYEPNLDLRLIAQQNVGYKLLKGLNEVHYSTVQSNFSLTHRELLGCELH